VRWRVLALLVLAVPPAGATAPAVAPPGPVPADGTPFQVQVRVDDLPDEPVEAKVWLGGGDGQASRTYNGTAFQRSDRYALAIEPGPEGGWAGDVSLHANPDGANHPDVLAGDEAVLGVRVRGPDGTATATREVPVLAAPDHRPVAAGAGEVRVARTAEGQPVAQRAHHGEARGVVEVAVPQGFEGRVCPAAGCPGGGELRLARVGEARAVVENAGDRPADLATAVVVLEAERCALAGSLAPGERVTVAPAATGGGDRVACEERPDPARGPAGSLLRAGRLVDQAPDPPGWGEAVRGSDEGWAPWRLPRGVAPAPVAAQPVRGAFEAFATRQDGLDRVLETIRGARERLTVTSYLFTNDRVADALAGAARRGVDVTLVLEPQPVGGRPDATDPLVDRLERAGVDVRWFGGPIHEHGLQHAKVVVADGSVVLVLTENLTHSGLPDDGGGNLGVGVGVANASLARRVEALFGQAGPARAWTPDGWTQGVARVALVTSPENAWRAEGVPAWVRQTGRVDGLALRVDPRWGPRSNAWVDALVDASGERPVRVLASGAPASAREDNRLGVAALEGPPGADGMQARVADPSAGTVHAKALVGPEAALVGSTNWGLGGVLLNREVNLLVEHADVASTVAEVFDRAWNGTAADPLGELRGAPGGSGGAVVAAAALAGLVARRRSR